MLLGSYQNVEAFAVQGRKRPKRPTGGPDIFKDSMVKNLVAFYQFTHYGAAL